ncbi:MAG TPA: lysylphosphatidylglycerol synthase transmembrane domain-containing protein [Methylomirabilota bacterium]|nr:lysylphosphatidylglycerol synthase transmembrane domain-containing protein [Methylomirabilota bacterium]
MRLLRLLLLLLGLGVLVALVLEHDPAVVWASIARLSWRLGVVLLFPVALVMVLDTLGWRFAFRRHRVPFGVLVATRLAGEAFNIVTPTAAMGGEVVKAWLLRERAPLDESVPSVIIAKTTITIAQGLFLLLGVGLAALTLRGSALLAGMEWLLGLEVLALGVFIVMQTRGLVGWSARMLARLGVRRLGASATVARVDEALAEFYARRPGRLALSIAFHLVAWLLGSLEAWLILSFLGVHVSLATATVIEAFGTGIRFATFLVPASLGAQEGGYVVTFLALGLGTAEGVSFGLVRRLRELVWVALGLLVFAVMRHGPVVAAPSTLGNRDPT